MTDSEIRSRSDALRSLAALYPEAFAIAAGAHSGTGLALQRAMREGLDSRRRLGDPSSTRSPSPRTRSGYTP